MPALYTFDVYSTLDGYGSYGPEGDWGGYWGKQGPEFLDRRLALYREPQRLVLGANTMRMFMQSIGPQTGFLKDVDPVNGAMRSLPTTVVSTTLEGALDWPDATLVRGDAVAVVARLKEESDVPLRSHGSLSMNRALMAAGLVDRVQVTIFPVVTGQTGTRPIFEGASRLRPRVDREQDTRRPHPGAHLPADASRLISFIATPRNLGGRLGRGGTTSARALGAEPAEQRLLGSCADRRHREDRALVEAST